MTVSHILRVYPPMFQISVSLEQFFERAGQKIPLTKSTLGSHMEFISRSTPWNDCFLPFMPAIHLDTYTSHLSRGLPNAGR